MDAKSHQIERRLSLDPLGQAGEVGASKNEEILILVILNPRQDVQNKRGTSQPARKGILGEENY